MRNVAPVRGAREKCVGEWYNATSGPEVQGGPSIFRRRKCPCTKRGLGGWDTLWGDKNELVSSWRSVHFDLFLSICDFSGREEEDFIFIPRLLGEVAELYMSQLGDSCELCEAKLSAFFVLAFFALIYPWFARNPNTEQNWHEYTHFIQKEKEREKIFAITQLCMDFLPFTWPLAFAFDICKQRRRTWNVCEERDYLVTSRWHCKIVLKGWHVFPLDLQCQFLPTEESIFFANKYPARW